MKIKPWCAPRDQSITLGRHTWAVAKLFGMARGLPVMEIPLDHLNVYQVYERLTMRELVMHMRAVQDADLSAPIILDEDGELMDGRHRIMKAMLTGAETIRAVRFEENPTPDRESD